MNGEEKADELESNLCKMLGIDVEALAQQIAAGKDPWDERDKTDMDVRRGRGSFSPGRKLSDLEGGCRSPSAKSEIRISSRQDETAGPQSSTIDS